MSYLNRRRLVTTLAATALGGSAVAAPRQRSYQPDPYSDPYYNGPAVPDVPPPQQPRNLFDAIFNPQPPQPSPYGQPGYGQPGYGYPADPYRQRPGYPPQPAAAPLPGGAYDYARIYGPVGGEPFPIPAFNFRQIGAQFLRQEVIYPGREEAGSVVVDPRARHLYYVLGGGRAIRYGVGVGRQGFAWSGIATINSKQEWPDWYPPKEMIERQPQLARSLTELRSGIGMAGGPRNPLGARAMYLWQGGKDTLYRIHGTVEPWTIGSSVSSGCIRMVNQDAIDLYNRITVGARVAVL